MDIQVEIHLSYDSEVWAYGMVTLENIIKFPVQLRKYTNKETGEETSFISYPRRERDKKWENLLIPDKELREEIARAVGEKVKEEIRKDLHLPEIEIISVSPIVPRYPSNAKAYICGVASIKILGLIIHGITIKRGQKGYFINMPQFQKAGAYHDVVYATGKAMQDKISECVLQEYQNIVGVSKDTIRVTSSKLISDITDRLQELQKNREQEKERGGNIINTEDIETKAMDESSLFSRTEDSYAIYQYDHTDGDWGYEFMGLDFVENMGLTVDGKDYRMMYLSTLNKDDTLDTLFNKFNMDRPDDFTGHPMSVSDVLIMKRSGKLTAYYVDSFGFTELPNFVLQRASLLNISIQSEYPPVYMGTLEDAVEKQEADAYLDSRKLNIDCKNTIEQAIKENYDGTHLNPNGAFAVIENFGVERVSFVLANTLHQRFKDGRFSDRNKQWGASIKIPENIRQGVDLNKDYIVNSHSAVLNGFIDLVRHEIAARRIEEILGKKRVDIAEKTEGYATEIDMNSHSDIDEAEVTITADTKEFEAEGHDGTWHTVDEREYAGEKFFLMEHDEYGSDVAGIIVSEQGQLVAEDLWNGYDAGALEAISEYLQEKGISVEGLMPEHEPDELAYKIDDNYFAIHTTEGGYDYTFYDEKYRELDGGIYDDDTLPITKVIQNLLEEEGLSIEDANIIDYEELQMAVENVEEEYMQQIKKERNDPSLNGMDREEIEETVLSHAQAVLEEMGLGDEVELLAAKVYGSRSREGLYRENSDLDVVLSYQGNIREDSFFNSLNEAGLTIAGMKVDINPISKERITLAEYIKESEAYLDQQEIKKLAVDLDNFSYDYDSYEYKDNVENREEQVEKIIENISNNDIEGFKEWLTTVSEESDIDSEIITARSLLTRLENIEKNHMVIKEPEQNTITFYVAECMEFPSLGESHENLTLDEALKIYESIPAERMSAIKGIGFDLQDGSDYEGKYGLMYLGRVDRENVEMIQHYKENPSIQKALDTLENYCKQDSLSADEKMKTDKQQDNNRKKKQTNIQRGLRI